MDDSLVRMELSNLGNWNITLLPEQGLAADIIRVHQVHGGDIVTTQEVRENIHISADGIVVPADKTAAAIVTADCLPLVVCTPEHAVVLHVSRKTLIRGLLDHLPEHVSVAAISAIYIGPHICSKHFSFSWAGDEIVAFRQAFPQAVLEHQRTLHINLAAVVADYLTQWQVPETVIVRDQRCTYETAELPSYRRSLDVGAARQGNFATVVTSR